MPQSIIYQHSLVAGKTRDFVSSLALSFEFDRLPDNITPHEESLKRIVEPAFAALVEVVKPFRSDLALFLYHAPGEVSFLTSYAMNLLHRLHRIISMDDLCRSLSALSDEEWKLELLLHFGSSSTTATGFYRELLKNPALTISYIRTLDVSDSIKLGLSNLVTIPGALSKELLQFLAAYRVCFDAVYERFEKVMEERSKALENALRLDLEGILTRLARKRYDISGIESVIYASHVFPTTDFCSSQQTELLFLYIGLEYPLTPDIQTAGSLLTTTMFKYLDAPKYIAVLRTLANGELCVTDIQRSLREEYQMPQPSLSGYLADLFEMGIVRRRYEGKRAYYEIDETYFKNAKAYISDAENVLLGR
ncbi:MAG: hypothetical protein VB111_11610 [Clostridiaceae bacterium]|nr:hypothetical protein [Clostridiaceae bacterium]